MKARIEEGERIIPPGMNVFFSWKLIDIVRKRKKLDFPQDIKLLSHLQSTYFTPAIERHKKGDYQGAMKFYEKAVYEGSQVACFNFGLYYLFGVGVKKDFEKGIEWLKKGGKVKEEEVWVIRELGNRDLFPREGVDMSGLFIL